MSSLKTENEDGATNILKDLVLVTMKTELPSWVFSTKLTPSSAFLLQNNAVLTQYANSVYIA